MELRKDTESSYIRKTTSILKRNTLSGPFGTVSPNFSSLRSSDQKDLLVGFTDLVDILPSLVHLLLFVVLEGSRTRRTTWITKAFP